MILHRTKELFNELGRAEVSFKPRPPIRKFSLLDLEDDGTHFLFNNTASVATYRNRLVILHDHFKEELLELAEEPEGVQNDLLYEVKGHIEELSFLLHPAQEDLVYAHVLVPKNSSRFQAPRDFDQLKKKHINI